MSEQISETKACDLLSQVFKARGYAIKRNLDFHEYGVSFHIDGWDAKARVGFEFLSSEDDDHDDLTLKEYQTLMDAQQRGELAIFIIDEVEPLSSVDLLAEADDFLDEVEAAIAARSGLGRVTAARRSAKAKSAKVKSAKVKSAKVKSAKAKSAKVKSAGRRTAAAKKPIAKKAQAARTTAAPTKAAKRATTKRAKKKR